MRPSPGPWRRRGRRTPAHDVVTPTAGEALRADLTRRPHRYAVLMTVCITLVLVGFFSPLPVPLRLGLLAVAAVLPPLAAIAGAGPRG